MLKNNCYKLNLQEYPLIDTFSFPENIGEKGHPSYINIEIGNIKKQVIDIFREIGIELNNAVLFCKKPGAISPLHTDIILTPTGWKKWSCAINWNLTSATSVMSWYKTTEKELYPQPAVYTGNYYLSGIHYGEYWNRKIDSEKTTLLDEYDFIDPCLFRTDISHQVKNTDNKDRWCLSVRPKQNYSWEHAVELFKPFL